MGVRKCSIYFLALRGRLNLLRLKKQVPNRRYASLVFFVLSNVPEASKRGKGGSFVDVLQLLVFRRRGWGGNRCSLAPPIQVQQARGANNKNEHNHPAQVVAALGSLLDLCVALGDVELGVNYILPETFDLRILSCQQRAELGRQAQNLGCLVQW